MKYLTRQLLFGSVFALGLASTSATAQHDSHGDYPSAKKIASSMSAAKCPVTGELINLAVSVATDGGPVFFCCKKCVSKYRGDPSKYAAKVAEQRNALADRPKVQATCPITKEPVDQNVFVERGAKKVYFCCKGCVNKYRKNPAKYDSALVNSYTYQTKCPVTDEEIDPAVFTTMANGMNIYFCCKGCDKKFLKDPRKYTPNLVAQGFTVNRKEMVHGAGK